MPILIALIFAVFCANAQNQKSEKALIKNAEGLFKNEMYIDAYPLYSQLLSIYPDDIKYNYKFSVCMLFADEEKEKAIMYLEKVNAKSNANKKALYYLAYAYHLNYEFNKAIIVYQKYLNVASKKDSESLGVQRKIEMCKNGLTLLQSNTKIGVVGKTKTKETEYFRSYDMQLLTGKILVKPDDFKTITDREKNEQSLVYLGKNAKNLFYSSYGNEGTNKDIFMVKKRPDGFWGAASKLPPIINSQYDEDFPVMHPKKNVLYFCSKGHNSMGGYDVFKTTYNAKKDYWTPPVNLDFAINSTDDDILYVPTDDELTAYFSSKRSSVQGQISVYKIKLKEIPGVYIEVPADEETEAGEPLALDDIHLEAELNVNAADENLVLSTAEEPNSQPSDAIQTETFIDLSEEEMIDVAFEYAQNLKDQEIKLKKEAEASFLLAREKNDQVSSKSNEAEAILTRIDNISDEDQKKTAIKKANNLKAESEKLAKEAGIAFEISKELAAEADERNKQAEKAKNNANKIESAVKTNQTEESISLLIEQKALAKSTELGSIGVNKMASEKETEAKVLESEAADAYEKIQFMENEISEIGDEIIRLEKEASITEDAILMEEILIQKQDLEFEKKNTEQELQATYSQAETLDSEAKVKRNETNLLKGVSNEIVEATDNIETASVNVREESSYNEAEEIQDSRSSTTEPKEEVPLVSISSNETEVEEESTEPLVAIVEENNEESDESYTDESDNYDMDESDESDTEESDESYSDESDESDTEESDESDMDEFEESDSDESDDSDMDESDDSDMDESDDSDMDESDDSDMDETDDSDMDESDDSDMDESDDYDMDESDESDMDDSDESDMDEFEESDSDESDDSDMDESDDYDMDESDESDMDEFEESDSDESDESDMDESDESDMDESDNEETQKDEYTTEINVVEELAAVEDLEAEAVNYATEASTIRENAESNNDPDSKENALKEAEELEIAAAKKKSEASKNKATVYSYTFTQNVSQYSDITNSSKYLENDDIEMMEQAMKEAGILYQQAQEIRQNASTISDPIEEANEFARADEKEEEAIATQEEAINQIQYKENTGEISQLSTQVLDLDNKLLAEIKKRKEESVDLFEQAEDLRKDISYIEDQKERETARRKSNAFEEQAIEKQITSINLYEFYKFDALLFAAKSESSQLSDEDASEIKSLQTDYNALFIESKSIRKVAEKEKDPEVKTESLTKANELESLAISKQKEALEIYLGSEELVAIQDQEEGIIPEENNEVENEENSETTTAVSTGLTEPSSSESSRLSEETITNTTEPIPAKTAALEDPRSIEELMSTSEEQKKEAQVLYESIETIESPDEMMAALDKAQKLEKEADANLSIAKAKQESTNSTESDDSQIIFQNEGITISQSTSESETIDEVNISESESMDDETTSESESMDDETTSESESMDDETTSESETIDEETISESESMDEETSSETTITLQGKSLDEASPDDIINAILNDDFTETTSETSAVDTKEATTRVPVETSSEETIEPSTIESTKTNEEESSSTNRTSSSTSGTIKSSSNSSNRPITSSAPEENFESISLLEISSEPLIENDFSSSDTEPAIYTSSNPIPVNPVIPAGLVFKVQVGAFRNPIPQGLFKGIKPIMGEKTTMGFIRYSAGLFKGFKAADDAKTIIRKIGYSDAFVVAIYNGKRILIREAKAIAAGGDPTAYATTSATSSSTTKRTGSTDTRSTNLAPVPGSIDISTLNDLIYTVQIGVYTRPTNLSSKYGLEPIYSTRTSNGYIKYSYGSYKNYEKANDSKTSIRVKGIKDAFVTAYFNGKRITLSQAQTVKISDAMTQEKEEESAAEVPDESSNREETGSSSETPDTAAVKFLVKIGEYEANLPIDEASVFFSVKDLGIERHESGETVTYTVGNCNNYEDAEELRRTASAKGISDASVIVLKNNKLISLDDYQEENND